MRRKLPDERQSITHKFDIAGHEGYITVGTYDDGTPGEIFLVMAKEGSTISGFADAFAQAISYALQYGVPLQVLVDKFSHARFEPSGMTKNPEIRFAKSIVDYVFRWMATKFLSPEAKFRAGLNVPDPSEAVAEAAVAAGGAAARDRVRRVAARRRASRRSRTRKTRRPARPAARSWCAAAPATSAATAARRAAARSARRLVLGDQRAAPAPPAFLSRIMFTATLRASGRRFDPDAFIEQHALEPAGIWHAGELGPGGRVRPESGFNLTIAEAPSPRDLVRVLREWVEGELETFGALSDADVSPVIELSLPVEDPGLIATLVLEPSDLSMLAALGITIRVSASLAAPP